LICHRMSDSQADARMDNDKLCPCCPLSFGLYKNAKYCAFIYSFYLNCPDDPVEDEISGGELFCTIVTLPVDGKLLLKICHSHQRMQNYLTNSP
jgi:hypothetical protein